MPSMFDRSLLSSGIDSAFRKYITSFFHELVLLYPWSRQEIEESFGSSICGPEPMIFNVLDHLAPVFF